MKKLLFTTVLSTFATAALGGGAFDPSQVQISDFTYQGTGCPQGTVSHDISEDGEAVTLLFDQFSVELLNNDSTRLERDRKACQLNFKLQAPTGWQFSVFYMDFRGFANIGQDAVGIQASNFRLGGGRGVNLGQFQIDGPFNDDYSRVANLPLNSTPWSGCNERRHALVVNTSVAVRGRNGATGYMTVDSVDGEITHSYGVAWRRCGRPQNPQEAWISQCKATLTRRADGKVIREFIGQGKGQTAERALRLARQHSKGKCTRAAERRGRAGRFECVGDDSGCSTSQL
jgi:hypothetical protein